MKNKFIGLGAATIILSSINVSADENPLKMEKIVNPADEKAMPSGACGAEGKCGGKMLEEIKNKQAPEGKCGESEATQKSPEGKCGGDKPAKKEKKIPEMKCGEGKCGSGM